MEFDLGIIQYQISMLLNVNISVAGYIPSMYNVLCITEDGVILLYNLLYNQLIELGKDDLDNIEKGPLEPESMLGRIMVDMKYVVSETENEFEYYRYHYTNSRLDQSTLSLSILTTMACNMSCPYCYEKKNSSYINEIVARQIIDWVSTQIHDKQTLSVNWFGGEPLLNLKAIRQMSDSFKVLCNEKKIKYKAGITTNGYLLTPEIIEMLEDCCIYNVQVTFDGSKPFHDKMKHLSDGSGSYDKIVSNIVYYCTYSQSHSPLRIRINVSDENYDSIQTLLQQIPEVVKEHSSVFFRWLYPTETNGWVEYSRKKSGQSPYKGIYSLLKMAHDIGFHIENRCESTNCRFCEADNPCYFTIDSLGYLYVCVHDYNPEFSVGHVSNGIFPYKQYEYELFRQENVLNDNDCLMCKLLPICNGGCRKIRIAGKKQCIFEKDNIDLFVENIYHNYSYV